MNAFAKSVLVVVILLCLCGIASAGQVNWVGLQGGRWDEILNWSCSPMFPSSMDDVRIDIPGINTITLSSSATVNSVNCSETLYLSQGSLAVAAPSTIGQGLQLLSGTLTADGLLTCSGNSTWNGGTITGWAGLSNLGTLAISGTSSKYLSNTIFSNSGIVTQTSGSMVSLNSSCIENYGLYDIQGKGQSLFGLPKSSQIDNFGVFRKSLDTGLLDIVMPFNNIGGQVDIWSGQLRLSGGGNSTGGVMSVASGASLTLGSTYANMHTVTGDLTVSGAGLASLENTTLAVTPGANCSFDLTGQGLQMKGTITASGAVTNKGIASWISGSIGGWGGFTNAGVLTIDIGGKKSLADGVLNNYGSVVHKSTDQFTLDITSIINNYAGAVYDVQCAPGYLFTGSNYSGIYQINNYGTFRKSVSQGTADIPFPFNNLGGNVDVSAGRLGLMYGGNSTGGSITLSNKATLVFGDAHKVSGPLTASGSGSINLDPRGTFTINAGGSLISSVSAPFNTDGSGGGLNLAGTVVANGPITNAGFGSLNGTISGRGGLINTGSFSVISGSLTSSLLRNSGTLTMSGANLNLADSSLLNNTAEGLMDMRSCRIAVAGIYSAKIVNSGVLRKSTTGSATIDAPFDNAGGTIDVREGAVLLNRGGKWTGGQVLLANNCHVILSGTHTINGNLSISGGGSAIVASGELRTVPGTRITVNAPASGLDLDGGATGGAGLIDITGGLQMQAGAVLLTEVTSQQVYGKVNCSGLAAIDGTLKLRFGAYAPKVGDRFDVLSYGERQGQFAHIWVEAVSEQLLEGLDFGLEYSDTGVSVVVTEKPAAKVLSSIAAARLETAATRVSVSGVVTAAFADYFYIEDSNRVAAIRVEGKLPPSPQMPVPLPGCIVQVEGDVAVVAGNLSLIDATWVEIDYTDGILPLLMNTKSLGGTALGLQPGVKDGLGLNNVGLLVRVAGSIIWSEPGLAYLDDGAGLVDGNALGENGVPIKGVKVITTPAVTLAKGQVILTCISWVDATGSEPVRALQLCTIESGEIVQ